MSSGKHLSSELYNLIKSIGETRSKQEEDKIITSEVQVLKVKINEKNIEPKKMKEYLIRGLYIEMLGQDAHFAHFHAIGMTQNKTLKYKRIGYLACSLFMHENSEFLILLVATLQKDLASSDVQEVLVALNTLGKLLYASIANALVEPVVKLLTHPHELIRKKALLITQKIFQIDAKIVADYPEKLKRGLCDKDPSVMGAALNLYLDEVKVNPSKYKDLVGSFVVILKQIIEHKLARDYDYHRMPAPWLQIRLLQILALLGENDLKSSEHIYEILSDTMKRADDMGINIGYALTYQCVKTISKIYPNPTLLESAANSLSRFLASENNNLKYLGINALISIVHINAKYALEHQLTVVECLESNDETLKRETLELLFKMTNAQNIEVIVDKLIGYLKSTIDVHFRKDLVIKIIGLAERFSPNETWFVTNMNIVLKYGAEYVDQKSLTNLLGVIRDNYETNGDSFGEFLINTYLEIINTETSIPDAMTKLIAWVLGEVGSKMYDRNKDRLDELLSALSRILEDHSEDELTKGWIINAIAKLSVCSAATMPPEVMQKFQRYSRSKLIDLQQRCLEYSSLTRYCGALSSSSSLKVDDKLSFLKGFVDRARASGAPEYNRNKLKGSIAALLIAEGGHEKPTLNYKPYVPGELPTQNKGPQAEKKDETGLKVRGPTQWTAEGFKAAENKPTFQPPIPTSGTSDKKGSTGFGSEDYKAGGISSGFGSNSKTNVAPWAPPPSTFGGGLTTNKLSAAEEAAKKEKEAKAAQLFGGLGGGGLGGKPTGAPPSFKPPGPTSTAPSFKPPGAGGQAPSFAPPKPTQQQPQKNVDLLDMDLLGGGAPAPAPVQQKPAFTAPGGAPTFQAPGSQGAPKFTPPSFGAPAQTAPSFAAPAQFQPMSFPVSQFEQYWTGMTQEAEETIRGNVKSEAQARAFVSKINFSVIDVSGNEVLTAGKTSGGEIVLLYLKYETSGECSLIVKSPNKKAMTDVLSAFKGFAAAPGGAPAPQQQAPRQQINDNLLI